jgi:hypothetical protein
MSPQAVSVIDTIQPYQAGYDALRKLHELNNFDKHRLLLVAGFGIGVPAVRWLRGDPTKTKATGFTFMGIPGLVPEKKFPILQDGAVIGRIHGSSEAEMDMDFQLPFEIAFSEPQIVQSEPVLPLLTQLSGLVEYVVNLFVRFL